MSYALMMPGVSRRFGPGGGAVSSGVRLSPRSLSFEKLMKGLSLERVAARPRDDVEHRSPDVALAHAAGDRERDFVDVHGVVDQGRPAAARERVG